MVLGANDGIVATSGLVIGVAASGAGSGALLTAGMAGLAAGALSMAVGEYVSVSTQRDTEKALLRKDFTIDAYQVYEARVIGADCILLIAAALDDETLMDLALLAADLDLDVLVEVHDGDELERALEIPAPLIGINNRNLRSFEVSLETSVNLRRNVPAERLLVSESGIATREDVAHLRTAGIHAFLVGEAFMRATDPGSELQRLFDPA